MSEDQPPPLVSADDDEDETTPTGEETVADQTTSSNIEFPLTHFYELEGRVHTDQWSIPYKRDESLAICMVATIKMIREGIIVIISFTLYIFLGLSCLCICVL